MNQTELISIIVPVYKVESYLDRCVHSIVEQTYRNLEIILVDDGSPDNCPVMCDAWAAKDSRIKVIHKQNGGLSDARNAGMAIATGSYIGFVDSDDYIAPEMYRLLFERLISDNCDISACGVSMVFEDDTPAKSLTKAGCCVLDREKAMAAIISESWLKQPVWYKLYKAKLIQDIPFPLGKYHEDVFWSYQAVARAHKVSVFDTPCYYYTQRRGSIMGEGYSHKRLDSVEGKIHRAEFVASHFPRLADRTYTDLLFTCLYNGQLTLRHLPSSDQLGIMDYLKAVIQTCNISPNFTRHLTITHQFWIKAARHHFSWACWLRNLLRIGL